MIIQNEAPQDAANGGKHRHFTDEKSESMNQLERRVRALEHTNSQLEGKLVAARQKTQCLVHEAASTHNYLPRLIFSSMDSGSTVGGEVAGAREQAAVRAARVNVLRALGFVEDDVLDEMTDKNIDHLGLPRDGPATQKIATGMCGFPSCFAPVLWDRLRLHSLWNMRRDDTDGTYDRDEGKDDSVYDSSRNGSDSRTSISSFMEDGSTADDSSVVADGYGLVRVCVGDFITYWRRNIYGKTGGERMSCLLCKPGSVDILEEDIYGIVEALMEKHSELKSLYQTVRSVYLEGRCSFCPHPHNCSYTSAAPIYIITTYSHTHTHSLSLSLQNKGAYYTITAVTKIMISIRSRGSGRFVTKSGLARSNLLEAFALVERGSIRAVDVFCTDDFDELWGVWERMCQASPLGDCNMVDVATFLSERTLNKAVVASQLKVVPSILVRRVFTGVARPLTSGDANFMYGSLLGSPLNSFHTPRTGTRLSAYPTKNDVLSHSNIYMCFASTWPPTCPPSYAGLRVWPHNFSTHVCFARFFHTTPPLSFRGYEDFLWFCLALRSCLSKKVKRLYMLYWFRCLDVDGDGLISEGDLEVILKASFQESEMGSPDGTSRTSSGTSKSSKKKSRPPLRSLIISLFDTISAHPTLIPHPMGGSMLALTERQWVSSRGTAEALRWICQLNPLR